jgi:predicted NAD/FAD-binding protein
VSRVAVVGSGISGLAASWLLSRRHDVVLFEQASRLGGHTHTHRIDTPDGPLALDTGFLVHNDRTYPLLVRLFRELGVETVASDMSFGVSLPDQDLEFSTRDLNGLFATRRAIVSLPHYRMLGDILRFNHAGRRWLARPRDQTMTLGAFLEAQGLRGPVVERFVEPLASAIWSTRRADVAAIPADTLLRFFDQHGMNTVLDHPRWKTVAGGAASYIPKLLAPATITVERQAPVRWISRTAEGVALGVEGRGVCAADAVVLACHGSEALALLTDASTTERAVLGAFETTSNDAWLHTDPAALPRRPAARASWNYRIERGGADGATVTYYLNPLQALRTKERYCVTLNPQVPPRAGTVLARMTYAHPRYTVAALAAQSRWRDISGSRRTHFAGAYWFYGFHEDGLRSAVRVSADLGVPW